MPTVRLLHVSDTHLRSGVGGTSDYHPGVDPAARLDIVLEAVARAGEPADVAVHSGDITDDFSLAAASTVRDRLASAAATVIAVPGNHDDPAVVATAFGPAHAEVHGWRLLGAPSTYYALAHDGPAMSLPESGCGARIVELHEDGSVTTSVVEA